MPFDSWDKLAELLGGVAPALQQKLDLIKAHPPDAVKQPVSAAIAKAYISRLEIQFDCFSRGAEGFKEDYEKHPNLLTEIRELETWILRKTTEQAGIALVAEHKDKLGDLLCSVMGYPYSKTRQFLDSFPRAKRGAPSKRPATLRMMDARVANNWSYRQLALKMCDCGEPKHNEDCRETIRKRLKELEVFLTKYDINVPVRPAGK
jgi:hypothetical protein